MENSADQKPSFHDNIIHSIEFIDEDYETTLVLDIDHITEWVQCDETYQFMISPAKLKFMKVSDLELKISKPGFSMGSYMETILNIESVDKNDNRLKYTITLLHGNYIMFNASSCELVITGEAKLKSEQRLTVSERTNVKQEY